MKRRRRRLPIAATLVAAAIVATTLVLAPVRPTAGLVGPGQAVYTVHTSLNGADRWTTAPVGVPTPVDATGDAVPEVVVTILARPELDGSVSVELDTRRISPYGALPLLLDVGWTSENGARIEAGFDGRRGGMPSRAHVRARMWPDQSKLDLGLTTEGAGPELDLIASYGAAATGLYGTGRVTLRPVPAVFATLLQLKGDLEAEMWSAVPVRAVGSLSLAHGAATNTATFTVDALPLHARVDASMQGARPHVVVDLDQPITSIDLDVRRLEGGAPVAHVLGRIRDVSARRLVVDGTDPSRVTFHTEGGEIGSVWAALGIRSHADWFDTGAAGDYVTVRQGQAAVRISGLTRVEVVTAGVVSVEVAHRRGPLRVDASLPNLAHINATVTDMPATATVTFDPVARRVSYAGSDPIGAIDVSIRNFGRAVLPPLATLAELRVRGIPRGVTLSWATSPGGAFAGAELIATPVAIGQVELLVTSGPRPVLDAASDGLVVRSTREELSLLARISGLRSARLSLPSSCPSTQACTSVTNANLETNGGRPVRVVADLESVPGRIERHDLWISRLPASLTLSMLDHRAGPAPMRTENRIAYRASDVVPQITYFTNAGARQVFWATIRDLPRRVDICRASDGACNAPIAANVASIEVDADAPITLDLMDCRTLSGCSLDPDRGAYLSVRGLRLQTARLAVEHVPDDHIGAAVDTDGRPITGSIDARNGEGLGFGLKFGSGFWAQDRKVQIRGISIDDDGGDAYCGPGVGFYVLPPWINIGGAVCTL